MAAVMHSAAELWVPCLRVTISSLQAVYPLDARPLGHDATLYCAPPDDRRFSLSFEVSRTKQGSSFMHVSTSRLSRLHVLFGSAWDFSFPSRFSRDSCIKKTISRLAVAVATPAANELALAGLP